MGRPPRPTSIRTNSRPAPHARPALRSRVEARRFAQSHQMLEGSPMAERLAPVEAAMLWTATCARDPRRMGLAADATIRTAYYSHASFTGVLPHRRPRSVQPPLNRGRFRPSLRSAHRCVGGAAPGALAPDVGGRGGTATNRQKGEEESTRAMAFGPSLAPPCTPRQSS